MKERSSPRRWCIPPGLPARAGGVEAGAIIEEVPGRLGIVLWLALGEVELWNVADPRDRRALFRTCATAWNTDEDLPAQIAVAIACLGEMVRRGPEADRPLVADACRAIADWAAAGGFRCAAVAFSQAAAEAYPAPAAAAHAGEIARRCGQPELADAWLRRAVSLARRAGDRAIRGQAYVALGDLWAARGYLDRAVRYYRRGAACARHIGASGLRGRAALGLFRIATRRGDPSGAERYHRAALRWSMSAEAEPSGPALEVAAFLAETGREAAAVPLLRRFLAGPAPAADRLRAATLLVRLAARLADDTTGGKAWDIAADILREGPETEETARALVGLARTLCGSLATRPRVLADLARARDIAVLHQRHELAAEAERLLSAARSLQS